MGETVKYKDKRRVSWPIAAGVLAVATLGGWVFYGRVLNSSAGAVEVSTIAVERGTIEISVNNSGVVEFGGQQTLKSPTDGTVDRVLVRVGDRVPSGGELITLRNNIEDQTTVAINPLKIREKQLSLGNTERKVLQAQDDLTIAQTELQRLVQENISRESLRATEESNRREKLINLETQRQKLREAQQKLQEAQQELTRLSAAESQKFQIKLAQLNLEIEKENLTLSSNRLKVIDAQAELAAAQQKLREDQDLVQRGFIAEQDVRQQESIVRSAEFSLHEAEVAVTQTLLELEKNQLQRETIEEELADELETAQKEVETAQETVRTVESDIRSTMFDVERIEITLDKLRREPNTEVEAARKAVREAEAQVRDLRSQFNQEKLQLEQEEIGIQNTQAQLAQNIVSTPIEATILQVMVNNGDGISRGDNLLTLGDPSQEFVNLQLSTLDASQVKLNQEARVTVIGPNAEIYEGVVQELSPLAITEDSSGSSSSSGQASVPATIKLKTPTGSLIPGAQVSVEIIVQQLKDVVALPIEVIQRDAPQPYIWTVDAQSQVQKKTIVLGLEGVTEVEIKSGLKVGDKVVLPPSDQPLEPGMVVKISKAEEPSGDKEEESEK
ncbi:HlyD family efflux transporter periplasmic adaptor subunit [Laspinema sp. A4]|uniref:HlyD family efflux transporter periplasmic adaptor subunit n=1 Tax=Laspinema sp. D2d TaxID=2953686 RepID=UPI0021BA5292|nr:HlyD family efflux transporter periplasmic adaptor subunit [Laspinema sp. D2d]MCT7986346.1 HlyD family efflux transporter periplasmic adaptor subunit [Laspinema sp. D2d]